MDKIKTTGLILGISAAIIGTTVGASLWGVGVLYLAWLPIGIALVVRWLVQGSRPSAEPEAEGGPGVSAVTASPEAGVATFTDIAFSENRPTWRGWRRDVGVARIRTA